MKPLLIALFVVAALPVQPAAAADPTQAATASMEQRYDVRNVNRTAVPCGADRATYRLSARLVGPGEGTPHRINVLVHDITAGGWFWNLREHPAYDYATRLAERGETSLVIDRLGYDGSPLPRGTATCLGAQADMLHQVVTQLRAQGVQQVVLHGHSVGAAIAELEAATFDDVDGLVLMSWADSGPSFRAVREALWQHTACLTGRGYAPYGRTEQDFRELLFATAPPEVVTAAAALRNPDPCGDAVSLAPLLVSNNLLTHLIDVPVLLLFGERDALTRPGAAVAQSRAYAQGADVEVHTLPGAGSALPLEGSAAETRELVLGWLAGL